MVYRPGIIGVFIILLSVAALRFVHYHVGLYIVYALCSIIGIALVHIALDSLTKNLNTNLGKDKFNIENESFPQNEKLVQDRFSVNFIPMRYYYKGKMRDGWINLTNPFRGTWVLGTPGSGKTFSIIEPIIRQHSSKGFSLVVMTINSLPWPAILSFLQK